MRIHLQDIERCIPETSFLLAEELVLAKQFSKLVEIERGIWTAMVVDVGEVELELNGNFFKNATCDCGRHQTGNLCEHVIGLLLIVRDAKAKVRIAKVEVPRKDQKPPALRFTSTVVIDEIDEEDLRKFVKEWARQNRPFEIALKAKFANQVQGIPGPDKYRILLEESRKSNRRVGKSFNIEGQRNYLRVIKELITQADKSLEELNFPECSALVVSLIDELQSNISFVVKSKHPILKPLKETFEVAKKLLDFPLAPELDNLLFDQLHALIKKPNSSFKYTLGPLLDLLLRWSKKSEKSDLLLQTIQELKEEIPENKMIQENLVAAQIVLLVSKNVNPFNEINNIPNDPEILVRLVGQLIEKEEYSMAIKIINFSHELNLESSVKNELETHWLTAVIAIDEPKEIVKVAEKRMFSSYDISFLTTIKEHVSEWDSYLTELFLKLEALPHSLNKTQLVADFFRYNEKAEALLEYIKQTASIRLMSKHVEWLFLYFPKKVGSLYPELLKTYAMEHIGPKATEKINTNLDIINRLLGRSTAEELRTYLLEKYKHTSLLKI